MKNDRKIQKIAKIFEDAQTLPIASGCVRMHPNGSEHVRKPRKTCENFEKPRENFEKLREHFRKMFVHGAADHSEIFDLQFENCSKKLSSLHSEIAVNNSLLHGL